MDGAQQRNERRRRRARWTAVILSLVAHGAVIAAIVISFLLADKKEEEEERELVFLEEPPPPPPPEPMVVAPPAAAPEPSRPQARPKAAAPSAQPEPSSSEPLLGHPDAPVSDEPIATSPDPSSEYSPTGPIAPDQIKTGLSWSAFEKTFESTALAARQEYEAQSMEKRRGGMRFGSLSGKVKAALENNKSWVAQGNQEQLSPSEVRTFRAYLESTHDKIHSLFADGFLAALTSLDPRDPLNNMGLVTTVEFEILANGKINEVHVLKTSGLAVFDAAAVDSLYRSSPFLAPPREILSWNDRAYFRWGFYRNQRKCGVFNAEPYRLRAPDAAPEAIPEDTRIFTDG
ncbi:MAG: TonB C-terminal domain-containing protein [Proteobacteria bacterium]|nr:TonB C-terminal domain-containing protein [Pseudomonadota bacterium]